VQIMRMISEWLDKPLSDWGKEEILKVLVELENSDYKTGTKNEFRKAMKSFLSGLEG